MPGKPTPKAYDAPGSPAAVAAGCTCAIIDNHHGAGYRGRAGVYVFTVGCPVHDAPVADAAAGDAKEGA